MVLKLALASITGLLLFSSCGSMSSLAPHNPNTAVRMPANLNEREMQNISVVEHTLRSAGYQPLPFEDTRASAYDIQFKLERKGITTVESRITLRKGSVITAYGSASRTAIERLFKGERIYQEIFDESIADFRAKLRPASGSLQPYRPNTY